MATNDFLPFAAAGGAGVITQAEYAALAARLSGFIDGIAEPTEVNKVWRQSAAMSAMLGKFISDAGFNALDDGDTATLTSNFVLALFARLRTRLTSDATVYVATTGSNSNPGTLASPFATIQYAYDYIAKNFDLAGYQVTIKVAAGTYTAGLAASGAPLGQTLPIKIEGANPTTGSGTIISVSTGSCFSASNNAVIRVSGFTLSASGTNGYCVLAGYGGIIYLGRSSGETNVFGATSGTGGAHIAAQGGQVQIEYNYSITGGATFHYYNIAGSIVTSQALTVTTSGTQSYAVFCSVTGNTAAVGVVGIIFSVGGPLTGTKYSASLNGVINTQGAGVNLFPGSIAGSTSTGGQYA